MDLPTCPACGQSVLDDDVEDCPFCGASMSGKPSAGRAKAPAKPAPARPSSAPAKAAPAASKTAASPRTAAAAAAATTERPSARPRGQAAATAAQESAAKADDDPFAVDTSAHARAVPLAPQPVKGRRHAVKCPMCETVGYTSTKAAGRDVRCANPNCLVPVFTAPAIEKPAEPQPEGPPKPRFTTTMLAAVSGVGLVIVGVCLWVFVFSQDRSSVSIPLGEGGPLDIQPSDPAQGIIDRTQQPRDANVQRIRAIPPEELRRRAFASMVEASQEGHQNRRSLSVRLTAEARAAIGDIPGAYEQLNRMENIRPITPHYAIPPLVEIAWQQLAAGRRDEAEKALNAAMMLKDQIAQLSQDPWDAAVGLAALLVAFDRDREAAGLLRDRDRDEERAPGVLWAQIRAAQKFQTFDVDQVAAHSPLRPWKNPPLVAVVFDLGAQRQFAAARRWAESHRDLTEKADCLAAWAETLVRGPAGDAAQPPRQAQPPLEQVRQAVSPLPPTLRAFVFSRLALRQAIAGDQAGAAATLQAAKDLLAAVSVPGPFVLPDQTPQGIKALLALQITSNVSLELAAIAAAETARVEALLGRTDEAWKSIELALASTRAAAPSRPGVNAWLELLNNRAALEHQLRLALETTSADRVRTTVSALRSRIERLAGMADARLELQVTVLSHAIDWKLADRVAQLVSRSAGSNDAQADPYAATNLPWLLAGHFRQTGAAEAANSMARLVGERSQPPDQVRVPQEMARLIAEGKVADAARLAQRWPLNQATRPRDETERNRWILRLTARLVNAGQTQQAFQFLQTLHPSFGLLRQPGYDLTAALATRLGHAQTVWQIARGGGLDPVERAAALHGLIVALDLTSSGSSTAQADAAPDRPVPPPRTAAAR